jgi:hypothetical protein
MEARINRVWLCAKAARKGQERRRLRKPVAARLGDKAVSAARRVDGAKLPSAAWQQGAEIRGLRECGLHAQAAIERRDAELRRLGDAAAGAADGDARALQHRADSAETVVVQLCQRVDGLGAELAAARGAAAGAPALEARAFAAERGRVDVRGPASLPVFAVGDTPYALPDISTSAECQTRDTSHCCSLLPGQNKQP